MKIIEKLDLQIVAKISINLTKKWTINEIANRIKKHYRPAYMAVQRLLKEEVLVKNQNNLIGPSLKNTFLFEAAERHRLSGVKDKEVLIVAKRLQENIKDSFYSAVLFGSSVSKKGRDIDLLFIVPDSENVSAFKLRASKALGSMDSKTDLNCINEESCYEMLNKPNELNVMNEIMKNHLVLTGYEAFYNIVRKWKND